MFQYGIRGLHQQVLVRVDSYFKSNSVDFSDLVNA